jgi:hypothetical protein
LTLDLPEAEIFVNVASLRQFNLCSIFIPKYSIIFLTASEKAVPWGYGG